ncbi:MAG: hypothetical protein M3016_08845 [Actinomycetota bacterium]|nr:hypothetical protein [Actinomycetota bacterium]
MVDDCRRDRDEWWTGGEMVLESSSSELAVAVGLDPGPDADDGLQVELLEQLRSELHACDVTVKAQEGEPPSGSKAGGGSIEHLVIAGQAVAIHAAVVFMYEWGQRHRPRRPRIRLEGPNGQVIEVPDTPLADAEQILASWGSQTT